MGWYYVVTNKAGQLDRYQIEENAESIYAQLLGYGWELKPICAVLGNIQQESGMNPAQTQLGYPVDDENAGYGLVQWTPASKYFTWCGGQDYSTRSGYYQVEAIETNAFGQYRDTPHTDYPLTYSEFKVDTTHTLEFLVKCWLVNYERAGIPALANRLRYANEWYDYFEGQEPPTPPEPPEPPEPYDPTGTKRMPVYMMIKYPNIRIC